MARQKARYQRGGRWRIAIWIVLGLFFAGMAYLGAWAHDRLDYPWYRARIYPYEIAVRRAIVEGLGGVMPGRAPAANPAQGAHPPAPVPPAKLRYKLPGYRAAHPAAVTQTAEPPVEPSTVAAAELPAPAVSGEARVFRAVEFFRPYLEAARDSVVRPALEKALPVFGAPGALVLGAAYGYFPGFYGWTLESAWAGPALGLLSIFFSWAVWKTLIGRTLKFAGLWDPFANLYFSGPWLLKSVVGIGHFFEGRKFGREAASSFAGWLEVLSCRWRPGYLFLGRPGWMLRPIGMKTERHMLTIAGTGAGKSTGALIPNLCLHRGSLLCIDPKGELARITARKRATRMKQDVHVLDPFGIVDGWQSSAYNVFDEMAAVAEDDPDIAANYAGLVARALVKPEGRGDPYWDAAAIDLLTGLILYVFQQEPEERRDLMRVRALLREGDVEGWNALRDGGALEEGETPFDVLLARRSEARSGVYGHIIAGQAGTLLKMGPNQRGSVLTVAQGQTSFLDSPQIRKIGTRSDFLLRDLKDDMVSVYLCLPLNNVKGAEGRWLRLFVMLFLDMMQRVARAPKPPVLLAIDEFPALGRLEGIDAVAPQMRSYGVRLWAVCQDLTQLKAIYPESWEGFIGNAEAVQFMGIKDPETVKFVVEVLGQHTVSEWDPQRRAENKRERLLRDPVELRRMLDPARRNQIVWRGGRKPLLLKICPYYQYLPFWYYDRDRQR